MVLKTSDLALVLSSQGKIPGGKKEKGPERLWGGGKGGGWGGGGCGCGGWVVGGGGGGGVGGVFLWFFGGGSVFWGLFFFFVVVGERGVLSVYSLWCVVYVCFVVWFQKKLPRLNKTTSRLSKLTSHRTSSQVCGRGADAMDWGEKQTRLPAPQTITGQKGGKKI